MLGALGERCSLGLEVTDPLKLPTLVVPYCGPQGAHEGIKPSALPADPFPLLGHLPGSHCLATLGSLCLSLGHGGQGLCAASTMAGDWKPLAWREVSDTIGVVLGGWVWVAAAWASGWEPWMSGEGGLPPQRSTLGSFHMQGK